jgi:thiol-disulfide isomerase/thioredoxin
MIAALAIAGCHKRTPGPEGDILQTLKASPINVDAFDAASLRGKPSLLLFVSPTCPHCLAELPVAQKVASDANANVVAVFIVGKKENATGVLEHTKFTSPALLDDGTLRRRYGIRSVPVTMVLGADGFAREQFVGGQDAETLSDALSDAR